MGDIAAIRRDIEARGIIAILRGIPMERLIPIADALYEGGIRLIECTFDHAEEGFLSHTARAVEALRKRPTPFDRVGAGTVLTAEEVDIAVDSGAEMIISPNADARVIERALERGAASIPGALTPTEIAFAHSSGATLVKLFPADAVGPAYLKGVLAPLRHVPLLAVGGVTVGNIPEFIKAGARGFGVSAPLLPKDEIDRGNYAAVAERARGFVEAFEAGRGV